MSTHLFNFLTKLSQCSIHGRFSKSSVIKWLLAVDDRQGARDVMITWHLTRHSANFARQSERCTSSTINQYKMSSVVVVWRRPESRVSAGSRRMWDHRVLRRTTGPLPCPHVSSPDGHPPAAESDANDRTTWRNIIYDCITIHLQWKWPILNHLSPRITQE